MWRIVAALCLVGCAPKSNRAPLDLAIPNFGDGGAGFATYVAPILANTCLIHHMTTAMDGADDLAGNAELIAYLQQTTATQCAIPLIDSRNPAGSFLYQKITGSFSAQCLASPVLIPVQMPPGGPYLSPAEIAAFSSWIESGAQAN